MKTSRLRLAQAAVLCAPLLVAPVVTEASEILVEERGHTVVKDDEGDLQLLNCNPATPASRNAPCTLPPGAPQALPGWADIKMASIHQIGDKHKTGDKRVDLWIKLHEPIPAAPPVSFFAYFWQFQDGCVAPSPTDKDGIRVQWSEETGMWTARWFVITSCNPRTVTQGDPVDFLFTGDAVRVTVSLSELIKQAGTPLVWFAGTRRMPFIHPTFPHTLAVDVAPDVFAFNPTPPPVIVFPEDSASWELR